MADFGLSKRIDEASNVQSKIMGVIPYIDPKRYDKEKGNGALQKLKLSDVYSMGVLFWELLTIIFFCNIISSNLETTCFIVGRWSGSPSQHSKIKNFEY